MYWIRCFLLQLLGSLPVLTFDLLLDKVVEANTSFTAQILAQKSSGDYMKICGSGTYSDDNVETMCIFYGYGTAVQVTDTATLSGYTFNSSYTEYGFKSIDCEDKARISKCNYTEIGNVTCDVPLVVACSDKWVMSTVGTTKVILPVALTVAISMIIVLVCYKDFRERAEKRKSVIKIKVNKAEQEKWATQNIVNVLQKKNENANSHNNNKVSAIAEKPFEEDAQV